MDKIDILVEMLREPKKDTIADIINARTGREACVLAKSYLTPQAYGAHLETFVKNFCALGNKLDELSGDAITDTSMPIEIKVSIQAKNGGFNYVQLRPHHDIDRYVILNYSIDLDKTIWLVVPSKELYFLLPEYGGYAHGTIKNNGKITKDNIENNEYEYALRPNMHNKEGLKSRNLWDLLSKYEVNEDELRSVLHKT